MAKDWLERQFEAAAREIATWPPEKREMLRRQVSETGRPFIQERDRTP